MALFPLNASILLEAEKKNVNKKIKVNPDDSDYEAMAEEDEDTGIETTDDEDTSTTSVDDEEGEDYASYNEEDDSIEPSSEENEEEDTDDDATDYSGTDDDESSTSDDIDSDDDSSNNSDEDMDADATDYGDNSDDADSSDDNSDYSSDESTDSESSSETDEGSSTDAEKNKLLINDFLNLYYFTRNVLDKLSTFDKGDILANSVITQVAKNITLLQSKLYDYIVNNFSEKYIRNLYQYNFFIQGIKVNIEMLKKIKDFNVN